MILRKWTFAVLGAWLGVSQGGYGQEPNRAPLPLPAAGMMPGETMARAIARRLKESGQLSQYRVNVTEQNGVVDLNGEVSDERQLQAAVAIVRATPGVQVVRDWLQIRPAAGVQQAQLAVPPQPLLNGGSGGGRAEAGRADRWAVA